MQTMFVVTVYLDSQNGFWQDGLGAKYMWMSQSCTTLDPARGSFRKFTGKDGSGWVGSSSARGQNLIVKCLDICILFCSLVCTMFQLYIQYLPCSFQWISVYKAMWQMVIGESVSARRHAGTTIYTAGRISCRNLTINIVVCRPVLQHVAATDGHQPFVHHFSLTCPLIKHQCVETWLLR